MSRYTDGESKKGSRRKNGLAKHSGEWLGFVDIELTADQKVFVADRGQWTPGEVEHFMTRLLETGYKLSLSPDELHHCVIVTITGKGAECPNAGYSLSARGPDWEGAMHMLMYKHTVLCDEMSWLTVGDQTNGQMSLWG